MTEPEFRTPDSDAVEVQSTEPAAETPEDNRGDVSDAVAGRKEAEEDIEEANAAANEFLRDEKILTQDQIADQTDSFRS